jgi:hypothetical protein
MNKLTFYTIIFSLISFYAKAEKPDLKMEVGFHFYNIDLEENLKVLNRVFAQENFPIIQTMPIYCGTFTINDKKHSADIKFGGSYQILGDSNKKTKQQNIMLIFEYRYNIPFRNERWAFYPAFAYGITYGKLFLIEINQNQFNSSVGNISVPDYFEKKYSFSTVFIHPKVGISYQFGINWLGVRSVYSLGLEMGYQLAFDTKLHDANRTFQYANAPKFNLSGFTMGFNIRMKLPISKTKTIVKTDSK